MQLKGGKHTYRPCKKILSHSIHEFEGALRSDAEGAQRHHRRLKRGLYQRGGLDARGWGRLLRRLGNSETLLCSCVIGLFALTALASGKYPSRVARGARVQAVRVDDPHPLGPI